MIESTLDLTDFAERLHSIKRDQRVLLRNLFRTELVAIKSKRSVRLHILKSDQNGRPQVKSLVHELCNTVLEYCIPRNQLIKAYDHFLQTGSAQRIMALRSEAQSLFSDISNTGEGGELLLFILTESVLGYPQALSKMALKTSSRMHVHGLDGVYISCQNDTNLLRLHFGESKLHKDPVGSVKEAASSVASMLSDEGFLESARRDYYLLNTYADLGDLDLEDALKGFLDPLDERFLAPEVCAVLLSGHELENYPTMINEGPLPDEVKNNTNHLIKVLENTAAAMNIDNFHIDLFLVPFPDIQAFRDELLKELGCK